MKTLNFGRNHTDSRPEKHSKPLAIGATAAAAFAAKMLLAPSPAHAEIEVDHNVLSLRADRIGTSDIKTFHADVFFSVDAERRVTPNLTLQSPFGGEAVQKPRMESTDVSVYLRPLPPLLPMTSWGLVGRWRHNNALNDVGEEGFASGYYYFNRVTEHAIGGAVRLSSAITPETYLFLEPGYDRRFRREQFSRYADFTTGQEDAPVQHQPGGENVFGIRAGFMLHRSIVAVVSYSPNNPFSRFTADATLRPGFLRIPSSRTPVEFSLSERMARVLSQSPDDPTFIALRSSAHNLKVDTTAWFLSNADGSNGLAAHAAYAMDSVSDPGGQRIDRGVVGATVKVFGFHVTFGPRFNSVGENDVVVTVDFYAPGSIFDKFVFGARTEPSAWGEGVSGKASTAWLSQSYPWRTDLERNTRADAEEQ